MDAQAKCIINRRCGRIPISQAIDALAEPTRDREPIELGNPGAARQMRDDEPTAGDPVHCPMLPR